MSRLSASSCTAVLFASAALALGACGDDEKNTTGAATNADTTTAENSTTGTDRTTTDEDRTTTRKKKDRTRTRERGADKGGGSNSGSGGGGSKSGGSDDSGSSSPAAQPGNVKKVARTVCNSFLPKQIQRDLESGKRKPESIAKDYSRGFPEKQQDAAYEGCLAGLKARS